MSTSAPDHLANPRNETELLLKKKWARLNVHNEHWMCVIVGEEGKGKSYTAIKVGELIDPNFTADNVFFDPADVLEALRDENYSSGDVWVLDEAGVGVGNRTWHDSGQVKLNQALQLVRSHNVGFIFTLPRMDELDKQAKGRLQDAIELVKKKDGHYVQGPWWSSNVDRMGLSRSGDSVWWSKPVINGNQVGAVAFSPPSEEIVEPYEVAKQQFQEDFYDETIAELRGEEHDGENGEGATPTEPAEIVEDILDSGVEDYLKEINNGTQIVVDREAIKLEYGIGDRASKTVKAGLKREGELEGAL